MTKKIFIFTILLFSFCSKANPSGKIIFEAKNFFSWLDAHRKDFAKCKITKEEGLYKLCDGTHVKQSEISALYKLSPDALVSELKKKGLQVEILCDVNPQSPNIFSSQCIKTSPRKMFQEMNSLHGQYLPEEKTILIRSSALKGSLIHEYVHFLQSENKNPIYGKIYKQVKNQVKKDLTSEMDRLIAEIGALEKAGNKAKLTLKLKEFMGVSDWMRKLPPWQDLIDEREIFLLYIEYGKEFGASSEDLALAKKNMGYICNKPEWAKLLPSEQCM